MTSNKTILLVEDDPGLQKQLKWALKSDYEVLIASNRKSAQKLFKETIPAVVVHDLGLPPDERGVSEGKASVKQILKAYPNTRIIVMTGQGDEKDAIELVSLGAHDFFSKPVEVETLKMIIERAFFLHGLESQNNNHQRERSFDQSLFVLPGVVGQSTIMQEIARRVKKVAKTSATTYIHGASGTGKELIARAIHILSDRKEKPFVAINCAAIPEALLESELFGYEKGAFTGANKKTIGKIEQANAGTLFLDEIGDMAYDLQSKILRFLQERSIQRLGGKHDISVDVRIISATHQDLDELIARQQFREDLLYRINEIEINLPEISERGDDIELISIHLLGKFAASHGKHNLKFTDSALSAIKRASWKGNVRQLSNQINRAVILSDSDYISLDDLELKTDKHIFNEEETCDDIPTLKQAKDNAEIKTVLKALKANNNNVLETAKLLGISRQRVYELLKKHKISG